MEQQLLMKYARVSEVPKGWKLRTVGRSCRIRNDLRKPISVEEREKIKGSFPYYGPTGILGYINEYLADGDYALIGEDGDHFLKYEEKEQTILVHGKFNVNNHAHLIEATDNCSVEWFYHFFKHRNITPFLSRQGAGRYKLNKETLQKLPILLPPFAEQTTIADLLSTWDMTIEKIERLIAAKEKRFSWLQYSLIFKESLSGKWAKFKLGDVFKERVEMRCNNLPLLSITREEGVVPREELNRKDTSNDDKTKYLRICPGDIGYNTMRMWQGVSALSKLEGIVSPAYTICIPSDQLHGEFIAHYFKTPYLIHKFYRFSQGLTSDTWNLKFKHFKEIKVTIPPLGQQEQIATTLNTARREIDLLKKQLDVYRKQKRGLMQKLLTGKWRVKVKEKQKTCLEN